MPAGRCRTERAAAGDVAGTFLRDPAFRRGETKWRSCAPTARTRVRRLGRGFDGEFRVRPNARFLLYHLSYYVINCLSLKESITKLYMSQENKLELPGRIRDYRKSIRLSQDELGERLGVSGNYISMIELGKKAPGPSLRKLFEAIEQSPEYQPQPFPTRVTVPRLPRNYQSNPTHALLSTETLIKTLAEVADKLVQVDDATKKQVVGSLREYLDEIEHRLISGSASSSGLSEAQQIAVQAAKPGGNH